MGGKTTGTVEINVLANQDPIADLDTYNVRAGQTLNVDGITHKSVLANDKDPENDTLVSIAKTFDRLEIRFHHVI
jgi:hypothetical protein